MRSGVELKRDAKARQCLVFLWRDLHSRFLLVAPLVFASFFLPPLFHCFSVYTITVVPSPAIDSSAQTPLLFPPTGRLYAVLNNRRRPHNRECCPLSLSRTRPIPSLEGLCSIPQLTYAHFLRQAVHIHLSPTHSPRSHIRHHGLILHYRIRCSHTLRKAFIYSRSISQSHSSCHWSWPT